MRYFTLAILLVSLSAYAQPTISKQVIGPAGATYENDTNKLSYTAGEVLVGAMTSEDGSIQLGNGYYPSLDLSTLNTEAPELQLQVKVYPNPVNNSLTINFQHPETGTLELIDLQGRSLLLQAIRSSKKILMNTSGYNSGLYIVKFTSNNGVSSQSISILH